ncbi:N-acetylmuramidase domain-containing protein [Mesorhizobium sp. M1004]|uniref:N-acetylmuramidase domain-containing protein n=1 Tax=Mesorhizobium sp. M1004 TaxID=2957046 RepID=UPI003335A78C
MSELADTMSRALAALQERINQTPVPPDRDALIAQYDALFAIYEERVDDDWTHAAKKVRDAAAAVQAVIDSGKSSPLANLAPALAAATANLKAVLVGLPSAPVAPGPVAAPAANPIVPTGAAIPLTQAGLENACQKLAVKAAEIWAVLFTETDPPYCGFWANGSPQILYEQHIFHRLTQGKFDVAHPDISSPEAGNYGASGAHQYARLKQAAALDESAALQSASWGIAQTLGANFKRLGFATPQVMVKQMFYSEDEQLLAGVREILASDLAGALAAHDWKSFATGYNGPAYWKNNYDEHLRSWYAKLVSGALPDLRVRAAQVYLMYLGYDPSTIDGIWGKRTQSALNQYRTKIGLPASDQLDDLTMAALSKDAQAAVGAAVPVL